MVVISVGDAIRLTYLPVAAASSSLKFCLHSTEETSFRFGCFTETTIFPRRRRRSLKIVGGARPTKYFLFSLEFLTKYCDHSAVGRAVTRWGRDILVTRPQICPLICFKFKRPRRRWAAKRPCSCKPRPSACTWG